MTLHTHYDNLQVSRSASIEVIRASHEALAQKYHPDLNPDDSEAARVMTVLNLSYGVLSDPAKRAAHDAWIAEQELSAAPSPSPPPTGAPPPRARQSAAPPAPASVPVPQQAAKIRNAQQRHRSSEIDEPRRPVTVVILTLATVLILSALGFAVRWGWHYFATPKNGLSATSRVEATIAQSDLPNALRENYARPAAVVEERVIFAAPPSPTKGGTPLAPKPALDQRYVYTATPNSSINSAATLSEELTSQRYCPTLRPWKWEIEDAIRVNNKYDVADDSGFKFRGGAALQIVFFLSADCTLPTKNPAIKKSPIKSERSPAS